MKIILLLIAVLIAPLGINAQERGVQEIIKEGELLTLDRCVEIALMHHPNVLSAKHLVRANESRVGQAKANYYPRIDLSSGYTEVSSAAGILGAATAGSGVTGRSLGGYLNSATISQTIYDFGKTSIGVKIQRLNLDSSRSELENVSDQVAFNAKQAYFGVLQAQRNVDVAAEEVNQFQKHLEQARAFYKAGTRPKIDVTKAEVDLSNAKLHLISKENALKVARVELNNAMGVPEAPSYAIEDILSFHRYETTLESAVAQAYESRADLKSLITRKEAAQASLVQARKDYYPTLSGIANYSWAGKNFPLEEGWSAGITLTFPLFSGFSTTYQVEEAGASLKALEASEEALRQAILLDVQQAYLNLREAEERVPVAEITKKTSPGKFRTGNRQIRFGSRKSFGGDGCGGCLYQCQDFLYCRAL
jgi:outer membrane protein